MSAFERWQKANAERVEAARVQNEKYAKWQQFVEAQQRAIPMRGRAHMRPTLNGVPIVVDPLVPPGHMYLINTQYMGFEPEGGTFGGAGASSDWSVPGDMPPGSST